MIVVIREGVPAFEVDEVAARLAQEVAGGVQVERCGATAIIRVPSAALDGREAAVAVALRERASVRGVIRGDPPYALVSRDLCTTPTVVDVRGVRIGGTEVVLAGGPCSVEDRDQLRRSAAAVKEAGGRLLRGGAFKPRTSPYAFQGLGEPGLELLAEIAAEMDLRVVTEVMAPEQVAIVASYADLLQVGSRNCQNFPLLRAVGAQEKPVLLKRGMMLRLDEYLASAEYIVASGNPNVVLCERGIRSFDPSTRNAFDVMAIPRLKQISHLPVIADPSHATGLASLVPAAACAAVAAGADGLLVEVHPDPGAARSDGEQALRPEAFVALAGSVRGIARALGRS